MDMVNNWARNTNADVITISESWLDKIISDKEIGIIRFLELTDQKGVEEWQSMLKNILRPQCYPMNQ